ncbi:MAG: amino acid adenylation domain-containing protein, partial [Ktedonobacteraceae bacterium]|nr:amino acid adenylation domain-containing protein [Ktedonobacteraceae bacterium]
MRTEKHLAFPGSLESPVLRRTTHRKKHIECLPQYFEQTCDQWSDELAVVCGSTQLTYLELDHRANRLAHLLRERGIAEGSKVGILLERSIECYVTLLGVLKAGAAYVPFDPSFPADRLEYIAQDAGLCDLVTDSTFHERTRVLSCPVLELDKAEIELAAQPGSRPQVRIDPSSLCYIIYTSGTTGRPKGVAVSHASIVNFLRVATPIYDVRREDRVYQGMSITFDFSFEEIWPTWIAAATLIAGPTDYRRLGQGLTNFLIENKITVLCCVPTLLATIEADVPSLRCLLVGGEACPADLVRRWARPGLRMLNTYGPTETTVTATYCELQPDKPVTLGTALPTYRVYILDEHLRPVEKGASGEICIGGPGVAIGYHNRPDLTGERFVSNPFEHDRAEAPRIYRSGDMGRFTPSGEIEYLGRIDTQVKIRGYRIEMGEIEEVLRKDQAVTNAVVKPLERDGVVQDLVGYVTLRGREVQAATTNLRERLHASLRRHLPTYMVPSFIEVLDVFPLLAAGKVDRAALPPPVSPLLCARSSPRVTAETTREVQLVEAWGEVLGRRNISVEDDFFCDLGGHSLAAARLISLLRKQPELQGLSIGDLYSHPTIRSLAQFIEGEVVTSVDKQPTASTRPAPRRHSTLRVLGCGLIQLIAIYGWMFIMGVPLLGLLYSLMLMLRFPVVELPAPFNTLAHASLPVLIAAALSWIGVFTVIFFLLPILGGRLLGRYLRPGWYPLWGKTFLLWWFYGKVLSLSAAGLLSGSPLLPPYLRLIGAKIGRHCHLPAGSIRMPMLLEIGERVSIGHGARLQPSIVEGGWLRLAPIHIGSGVFIGANSIVMAGAQIGDQSSIGEQSLVSADQIIPANEHWAGSPIKRLQTPPTLVETLTAQADDRRWPVSVIAGFIGGMLLLGMLLPLLILVPSVVIVFGTTMRFGLAWGLVSTLVSGPISVLFTCLVVIAGKWAVMPVTRAGIYPQRSGFGVRKWISGGLMAMSLGMMNTLYATLYVVPFLRLLGARIGRWSEVSTVGSLDPDMLKLGDESFVADIAVIAPAVYHRGRIALAPAQVGR